jgi:hypothetical protein
MLYLTFISDNAVHEGMRRNGELCASQAQQQCTADRSGCEATLQTPNNLFSFMMLLTSVYVGTGVAIS